MIPRPRRRSRAPLRRVLHLATLLALATAAAAWAQEDALAPCTDGLPPGTTTPDPTWRTVVDVGHAFGLRLPDGYVLSRVGDTTWYAHGFLEGDPLVPDVAISFLTGITIGALVERDFPAGATLARIRLGPATSGARVDATYATPDGTPYRQSSYLAEIDGGVLRVDRYEGFDWDAFDAVACSVHAVDLVE